jgi:hypothetical protein
MMEGNIGSATKFDDGKITTEQWAAEIRARWEEFVAKNDEGSPNPEREHRQDECNDVIRTTLLTPWLTPGLEADALEKLQSLGCLK